MSIVQAGLFGGYTTYCENCGRQLSNPISVTLHIGPICMRKKGVDMGRKTSKDVFGLKWVDMSRWGTRFNYSGYYGHPAHCYIKVCGNVVLCTEAPDNEGTSITNMAEHVAEEVAKAYQIRYDKLVWIEHYLHEGLPDIGETFDLVKFDLTNSFYSDKFAHPTWQHLEREAVERMIGVL
jgi:hypothetical protein